MGEQTKAKLLMLSEKVDTIANNLKRGLITDHFIYSASVDDYCEDSYDISKLYAHPVQSKVAQALAINGQKTRAKRLIKRVVEEFQSTFEEYGAIGERYRDDIRSITIPKNVELLLALHLTGMTGEKQFVGMGFLNWKTDKYGMLLPNVAQREMDWNFMDRHMYADINIGEEVNQYLSHQYMVVHALHTAFPLDEQFGQAVIKIYDGALKFSNRDHFMYRSTYNNFPEMNVETALWKILAIASMDPNLEYRDFLPREINLCLHNHHEPNMHLFKDETGSFKLELQPLGIKALLYGERKEDALQVAESMMENFYYEDVGLLGKFGKPTDDDRGLDIAANADAVLAIQGILSAYNGKAPKKEL